MPCTGGAAGAQRGEGVAHLLASQPGPIFWQHLSQAEAGAAGTGLELEEVCVFAFTTWRIPLLFRADGGKMNFLLN